MGWAQDFRVSLSSSYSILTLTLPGNIPFEIMGLYRVGAPKVKWLVNLGHQTRSKAPLQAERLQAMREVEADGNGVPAPPRPHFCPSLSPSPFGHSATFI